MSHENPHQGVPGRHGELPRGPLARSRARPAFHGMRGPRTRERHQGHQAGSRTRPISRSSIHAPTVARRFVWMAYQSTGSSPQGGRGRRRLHGRSIRSLARCPSTSSRGGPGGRSAAPGRPQGQHRGRPAVSSRHHPQHAFNDTAGVEPYNAEKASTRPRPGWCRAARVRPELATAGPPSRGAS